MLKMENTTVEVENKEIIEEVIDKKESKELSDINIPTTCAVAVFGGIKQLASKEVWAIGLGTGLLFGKKSGIKSIVTLVGVGAVYNAARYLTGEFHKKK
jgi:hypothetical protein